MDLYQYERDDVWSHHPNDEDFDLIERSLTTTKEPVAPTQNYILLGPLASAQESLTRLDALASVASPDVANGLRARMAFREASGWLAYSHVWIHHNDLALRSSHTTGSYSAAALRGDIRPELPNTMTNGHVLDLLPDDNYIEAALRLAQLWRRMAEHRTWSPLADIEQMRETLEKLSWGNEISGDDIEVWLVNLRRRTEAPALLRAAFAARTWGNLPGGIPDLTIDGMFLAAATWKERGSTRCIPLPFWAAPTAAHNKLSLKTGVHWTACYLDCVSKAAQVGLGELKRLEVAASKAKEIDGTARSMLPAAIQFAIRMPIITAKSLALGLKITPQAASGLVNRMFEMGLLHEATRRASWRAFVLK